MKTAPRLLRRGLGGCLVALWCCAPVAQQQSAKRIVTGHRHACTLSEDAVVRCWGSNSEGQTGQADRESLQELRAVEWLPPAVSLAAGGNRTCAITTIGTLVCWGALKPAPVAQRLGQGFEVEGLTGLNAVAVSAGVICAADENGSVFCWGVPVEDTRETDGGIPVVRLQVEATRRLWAANTSLGLCGLTDRDEVWCLGTFGGAVYRQPQAVPQLRGAASMNLSVFGVCAVTGTGAAVCVDAQGLASPAQTLAPSDIKTLTSRCALKRNGSVTCTPYSASFEDSFRDTGWWCLNKPCAAGEAITAREVNDRDISEGGTELGLQSTHFLCGIDVNQAPWCRDVTPQGLSGPCNPGSCR